MFHSPVVKPIYNGMNSHKVNGAANEQMFYFTFIL